MLSVAQLSCEEIAVLYRLFRGNDAITALVIKRDAFSGAYVTLEGVDLYYPQKPIDMKTCQVEVKLKDAD